MKTSIPPRLPRQLPGSGLLCILAATVFAGYLHAQVAENTNEPRRDMAQVAPWIDDGTILVAKFDLARIELPDVDEIVQQSRLPDLSAMLNLQPLDAERARQLMQGAAKGLAALRAGLGEQPLYALPAIPRSMEDNPLVLVADASERGDREALADMLQGLQAEAALHRRGRHRRVSRSWNWMQGLPADKVLHEHEGQIVFTSEARLRDKAAREARSTAPREELEHAFQAVADFPIQILLLPPAHLRRSVLELLPQIPQAWGGGPSEVWVDGVHWAALGFDPGEMRTELVVQAASTDAAQRLGMHVEALLANSEAPPMVRGKSPLQPLLETLRGRFVAEQQEARWVVRPEDEASNELATVLLLATASGLQQRLAAGRDGDKLKQILLAMHDYHHTRDALPPPAEHRDEQGRPNLSWRVHLLPFLDHAELFQQFRLDEPWDSDHNRGLIEKMPPVYAPSASGVAAGHTTFLAPVGEDTIFGGTEPTRFRHIIDGTSNTAAVVVVQPQRAVPWTAPEDYVFDPEDPAAGLEETGDGTFSAALMDGNVHSLRKAAPHEMLRRLFQKSDRQTVNWSALR